MKQEDLIPGNKYDLVYSGEFCHNMDTKGLTYNFKEGEYIFVGTIDIGDNQIRNIFYIGKEGKSSYVMFSCNDLDYVVDNRVKLVKDFMEENNLSKEEFTELINKLK